MRSFEVHSNESACRKSGRLGQEQVDISFKNCVNKLGIEGSLFNKNYILGFYKPHQTKQ